MTADLISLLSLGAAWLAARGANAVLRRAGWSKSRRRVVPMVAAITGAATSSALQAAQGGAGWHDMIVGALAGASAVAVHELAGPKPAGPGRAVDVPTTRME